jgi:putative IMPACT (imprinted ancient) family translation regulator
METMEVRFNYPQMNEVMKVIKKYPIQIVAQEVNNDCLYTLCFAKRISAEVQSAMDKALSYF